MTSSPFLLTSTTNKQIKTYNNEDPNFVEKFLLHVDELDNNLNNNNNKAKARLDQASFNLRKFQSNSSDLEYFINGEINHNSFVTKVLGLIWEKYISLKLLIILL